LNQAVIATERWSGSDTVVRHVLERISAARSTTGGCRVVGTSARGATATGSSGRLSEEIRSPGPVARAER
jgi:hypothetical protein